MTDSATTLCSAGHNVSLPSTPAGRRDDGRRIAVVGASGFIGAATLRVLRETRCQVTAVVRQQPTDPPDPGVRVVLADVTDRRSLQVAFDGIDVVVHAASYTGSDARLAEAINLRGTENVLAAAGAHGIEHVINVSTIGVYGLGPFRNVVEGTREPSPVTALSTTRAAADRIVRDSGGTTVRPGFVHGRADRWFLPGLRHILDKTRAWIDRGVAELSVIGVDELGTLIAELAMTCADDDQGGLFHAANPESRSVHDLATELGGGFIVPSTSYTYEEALIRARDRGVTARHLDLVGHDHTIDGSRLWGRTGRT